MIPTSPGALLFLSDFISLSSSSVRFSLSGLCIGFSGVSSSVGGSVLRSLSIT